MVCVCVCACARLYIKLNAVGFPSRLQVVVKFIFLSIVSHWDIKRLLFVDQGGCLRLLAGPGRDVGSLRKSARAAVPQKLFVFQVCGCASLLSIGLVLTCHSLDLQRMKQSATRQTEHSVIVSG